MSYETHSPVVVLPAGGPLHARLAAVLRDGGVSVLDEVRPDLEVAVVDLEAPQTAEALATLAREAPRAAVLGVAQPTVTPGPTVIALVTPASIETELLSRLAFLRSRLASFREARQRQRDLQVLLELTRAYAEASDIDELFYGVTRRLAEEVNVDRVALLVVDAQRDVGTIVASSDDPSLKDLRIDLGRYPEVREVLRTAKPVILDDAPHHPLLEDVKEAVSAQGIRSIAALPLAVRGQVEGALLLRRSTVGAFTLRELEFLTAVANATAVAFRNLTRLERVRGQREQEKSARLAAEAREAATRRYQAYFDHLSDGVAIVDAQARVVSLNPAGQRLFDVDDAAAVGQHINALTNPSDEALLVDVLSDDDRGQGRGEFDLVARTGAGRQLTLSVSAAPLSGEVAGEGVAVLTLRDVTRQRAMAEQLRQTSDFLERLIDSSVDAVIAADMRGNVILFNKAAEVLTGYAASAVVGKLHVTRLYPEGQARALMAKLRGAEDGGRGRLTTNRVELIDRRGDRIPVNMTASIIYEGARETGTVGIFTDLRDRLSLERRLTDAEARLLESEKNAVIVALAGTAAHELNQPLTSVMGYAELLKRKISDTDASWRAVDIIHREAERMAEIVKKIGKITRFETKAYVGSAQIVDLDKAVSHDE